MHFHAALKELFVEGRRMEGDKSMTALRWGLIGCGDISRKRVAPALRDLPDCELVAVSRGRAELAAEFAAEFGARRWHADWRDLVADEEVGAVYVATPVRLHAEQTVAAAEAGKHVLCEKPMALTTADCDRMIAACAANGVRLGVAYYRRFYPVVERVRALLASGAVGRPVVAQLNAFEWFDPAPTHPRRWLLDKQQAGGGPMLDFGSHRVEVLLNLFGTPRRVGGLSGNVHFEREVEDTATALFEFERGPHAVLTVTHAAREPRDTLDIYGTEGSLHVPVLNAGQLRVKTRDGEHDESHPPHPNLHQPLIEDFTRAVLERRDPVVNGAVGREVSRLLEEAYKTAVSG
jgi:predicted dehydrogenase